MPEEKKKHKISIGMHYTTTVALIVSNLTVLALLMMFTNQLSNGLGYFEQKRMEHLYKADVVNAQGIIAIRYRQKPTSTLPLAPTNLFATASTSDAVLNIILTWNDNSDNEDGFNVERFSQENSNWKPIDTSSIPWFTDRNLNILGSYSYRVRAYNGAGSSPYSNIAIPVIIPAPSGLSITASSTDQLILNWEDNSFNEIGFGIERSGPDLSGYNWNQIATSSWNWFYDNTLEIPGLYSYRIRAYNDEAASGYSNTASHRIY
jgi:hypothetical protein